MNAAEQAGSDWARYRWNRGMVQWRSEPLPLMTLTIGFIAEANHLDGHDPRTVAAIRRGAERTWNELRTASTAGGRSR